MPTAVPIRFFSCCARVLPFLVAYVLLACAQARGAYMEDLETSGSIFISGDGATVVYGSGTSFLARKNRDTSTVTGRVIAVSQDGSAVLVASGDSWSVYTGSGYSSPTDPSWVRFNPQGISPDGKVVAGYMSGLGHTPMIWTTSDYSSWTGKSLGGADGVAYDVSSRTADGKRVAVGTDSQDGCAWFVDASTGAVTSQTLSGPGANPIVVNADGTLAAGYSLYSGMLWGASIWNTGTGVRTLLDHGTAKESWVSGMNTDGSVFVGYGTFSGTEQALYWSGSGSTYTMHNLRESLEGEDVSMDGWVLSRATGVSDDGNIIVGTGSHSDADVVYLANLGEGALTSADSLARSVASMGPVGRAVSGMGALSMSRLGGVAQGMGSHFSLAGSGSGSGTGGHAGSGESGLSGGDAMTGSLELWGIGSLGSNYAVDGDDIGLHGGIGLTWHTGGEWRFGGGVFGDTREMDTEQGGSQRVEALGPGVFVVYSPANTGLEFGVSALWQSVDLRLTRGYVNGAGYSTSTGTPTAEVLGLTGRVQWTTQGLNDALQLTPFLEYTWQSVHVEGYDESDGPFPASFDSRNDESNSMRLGLRLDADLFDDMGTWAWVAMNHRFEDKSSALGGTVAGLGRFNYDGAGLDQEWFDMGLGASWQLSERLSTDLTLGTALGCDDDTVPDMTAGIGFSYSLW